MLLHRNVVHTLLLVMCLLWFVAATPLQPLTAPNAEETVLHNTKDTCKGTSEIRHILVLHNGERRLHHRHLHAHSHRHNWSKLGMNSDQPGSPQKGEAVP